ncbi:8571_t:CDS:2, partial [Ambispora leptoticha]
NQKDPAELDFLVTYKYYADYVLSQNPKMHPEDEELHKLYTKYKEEFGLRQLRTFFEAHRNEEWFLEKYHPTHIAKRATEINALKKQLYDKFITELKAGKFDAICNENEEPETTIKEDAVVKTEETVTEVKSEVDDDGNRLFIKSVPPTIKREKIIENLFMKMCNKVEGFKYLALSEPNPSKKFHRLGWIVFEEGTNMDAAYEQLNEQKVDEFTFYLARHKNAGTVRNRVAPEIANHIERVTKDKQRMEDIIKKLDKELGFNGYRKLRERINTITNENKPDYHQKSLDLYLEYARRVHLFCYYCGSDSDSVEEFARKCPGRHLRKKGEPAKTSKDKQNQVQWLKTLENKIDIKLNPEIALSKIQKLGGKNLETERDAFLETNTVEMEPGVKFRCSICGKLFKGQEFVRKHICLKHADKVKSLENEITFLNNYVMDPSHLLPTTPPNPIAALNSAPNVSPIPPNPFPVMGNGPPAIFPFNFPAILGAAAGTPHDQIPRIGFDGRNDPRDLRNQKLSTDKRRMDARARTSEFPLSTDPRQVKSYVDLDAPAEGDIEIKY